MAQSRSDDIEQIAARLAAIDETFVANGVSSHFMEIVESGDGSGITVRANAEGLVHLACKALEIAGKGIEGSHHHFDNAGILDRCDKPLTICFSKADWDRDE